jgi:hypothetical protein
MENKESKAGKSSSFQFVSVTKPGHGWKNENEHIVRSHVMRQLRQKQREERKAKRGEKDVYRVPRSAERYAQCLGGCGAVLSAITYSS